VQAQEYVGGSGCEYQGGRSHRHTAAVEGSAQVWRGECGLALGRVSLGRRWARREQCCSVSWDENAWRVGGRSGPLVQRHVNAISTLRSDQFPAGEFDWRGYRESSMGDGASCRSAGDVAPECFLARPVSQRWRGD
jgi:hypothetical protein